MTHNSASTSGRTYRTEFDGHTFLLRPIVFLSWVLLGAMSTVACSDDKSNHREIRQNQDDRVMLVSKRLGKLHGATLLSEKDSLDMVLDRPLTLEIQKALVDSGRPVVTTGKLEDLVRDGSRYVALFSPPLLSGIGIQFALDCSEEFANRLAESRGDQFFDKFVFVASIKHVRRPNFSLYAIGSEYEADINIDVGGLIIATGELIDFEFVGFHQ